MHTAAVALLQWQDTKLPVYHLVDELGINGAKDRKSRNNNCLYQFEGNVFPIKQKLVPCSIRGIACIAIWMHLKPKYRIRLTKHDFHYSRFSSATT
jgi:hypothetical protein